MLRSLARLEARVDRWFAARRADTSAVVEPYLGYSTPEELILRGRVLARIQGREVREGQGLWSNLRGMLTLFATDEVAGTRVCTVDGRFEAVSDEEGYFTLIVPRGDHEGWSEVAVTCDGSVAQLPVLVTGSDARFGVISDVDDTVMYTGAWSLARNLWTTFSGNITTRQVFPDAVTLMARLSEGGRNPVFYVSSSPWNLHGFLAQVMDRAGLVRGPKFLRDLGLNETEVLGGSHHSHKGSMIDRILAANPELSFILIGDTGQKDGSVYHHAAERHPGRDLRVILRRAGGGAKAKDLAGLAALNVQVDEVASYDALSD